MVPEGSKLSSPGDRKGESSYSGSTADIKGNAMDQFEQMASNATDKLKSVADQAEGVANRVIEQGQEAGEQLQQVAGSFKGAVERSLKEQPMATSVVLGIVLGALWRK